MADVAAIVLAGGNGKRAGAPIPKQYMEAGGRPLLWYSLESFEKSCVDAVFVVAGEGYEEFVKTQIVEKYGFSKVKQVIRGGEERWQSVYNALKAVKSCGHTFEYVLIHDGARPFIVPEGINKMVDAVFEYGAAVAAVPVSDTIKITDAEGFVSHTTERARTWAVQTPQCFRFEKILEAYEKVVSGEAGLEHSRITDDSMIYENVFSPSEVKLIDMGVENGKVTTPSDLAYAAWRLK